MIRNKIVQLYFIAKIIEKVMKRKLRTAENKKRAHSVYLIFVDNRNLCMKVVKLYLHLCGIF